MRSINFWRKKLTRRAVQWIGSQFYVNPASETSRSILVAGTARSGTTWLGDLISSQLRCRIMFEPFNPDLVPEYRGFHYFQYMRPGSDDPKFQAYAQQLFTGGIRSRWIDKQNEILFADYRLIKEIRINLALKWLHDQFPEVPIVFLLRHPCAVVLSRMQLGWATDQDIAPFLVQPDLVNDYLFNYLEIIQKAESVEEKHAIIWCISNLVPLRQFKPSEIMTVFYENLYLNVETELDRIFQYLGPSFSRKKRNPRPRPSQTTKLTSPVVSGNDVLGNWKNKLSATQIDRILSIVHSFGLDNYYCETIYPAQEVI